MKALSKRQQKAVVLERFSWSTAGLKKIKVRVQQSASGEQLEKLYILQVVPKRIGSSDYGGRRPYHVAGP